MLKKELKKGVKKMIKKKKRVKTSVLTIILLLQVILLLVIGGNIETMNSLFLLYYIIFTSLLYNLYIIMNR